MSARVRGRTRGGGGEGGGGLTIVALSQIIQRRLKSNMQLVAFLIRKSTKSSRLSRCE